MTCAHELGHILLHRDYLIDHQILLEMDTYDPKNRTEYEANQFAANLLIDENELKEQLNEGLELNQLSALFDINENLLILKLEEMKKSGIPIQLSFLPKRTFMGTIKDSDLEPGISRSQLYNNPL